MTALQAQKAVQILLLESELHVSSNSGNRLSLAIREAIFKRFCKCQFPKQFLNHFCSNLSMFCALMLINSLNCVHSFFTNNLLINDNSSPSNRQTSRGEMQ